MDQNDLVTVLLGDLGYGIFDDLRARYPERCLNVGSSEQLMLGMAVGMALEGKIPICYSISPFLVYRPFEFIRNYLHHEGIPVKLVGSGRDFDYGSAGFTHHSPELKSTLKVLNNIDSYWPEDISHLENDMPKFLHSHNPAFISLRR